MSVRIAGSNGRSCCCRGQPGHPQSIAFRSSLTRELRRGAPTGDDSHFNASILAHPRQRSERPPLALRTRGRAEPLASLSMAFHGQPSASTPCTATSVQARQPRSQWPHRNEPCLAHSPYPRGVPPSRPASLAKGEGRRPSRPGPSHGSIRNDTPKAPSCSSAGVPVKLFTCQSATDTLILDLAGHFHGCDLAFKKGRESTIFIVPRLTVTMRARRSMMYRGSPTSFDQSFGSLTMPDALSVLM